VASEGGEGNAREQGPGYERHMERMDRRAVSPDNSRLNDPEVPGTRRYGDFLRCKKRPPRRWVREGKGKQSQLQRDWDPSSKHLQKRLC